jgi:hypothetical protein
MNGYFWLIAGSVAVLPTYAGDFQITRFAGDGSLAVSNAFTNGVVRVEKAQALPGPWVPQTQTFSTGPVVDLKLALSGAAGFFRSRALDLSGPGSWTFSSADILDLPSFAGQLLSPPDGVSQFLWYQLPLDTQDLLLSYGGGEDLVLRQALVYNLNLLIQGGSIYDAGRFAGVNLSAPTQRLLTQAPQGAALISLNRMLLQDAYPQELAAKSDSGFANLISSYGLLTTVAGAGGTPISPTDKWLPEFEGGPATNALLSRPHIAMADRVGNIYIADKEAHAIRKVTVDGNIHTVAGNGLQGYGTTAPAPATSVSLDNPNGLWVRDDGTFYILDRDNGLIRKVDTNGTMTTLVNNGGAIPEGRGLWVSPDESSLFFSAGSLVKRWDTTNGLSILASGFIQLGNLAVDPRGRLAVTDRRANTAYWVASDGTTTVLAGNGGTSWGGDGNLATETGLLELRGIWFLPTGAFFLATDTGSQVWYVDTDGYIHLFLNGDSVSHAGDGGWFYDPATPKVSKVRQITMDYEGSLIITENDSGYIRKVQFLSYVP